MLDLYLHLRQNHRIGEVQRTANFAETGVFNAEQHIRALEKDLDLLTLVNQALFELLSEKLGVSEEEMLQKVEEIDLRDGVKDGKLGTATLKCPKCNRGYNMRLDKCLYCGYSNNNSDSLLVDKYNHK